MYCVCVVFQFVWCFVCCLVVDFFFWFIVWLFAYIMLLFSLVGRVLLPPNKNCFVCVVWFIVVCCVCLRVSFVCELLVLFYLLCFVGGR